MHKSIAFVEVGDRSNSAQGPLASPSMSKLTGQTEHVQSTNLYRRTRTNTSMTFYLP